MNFYKNFRNDESPIPIFVVSAGNNANKCEDYTYRGDCNSLIDGLVDSYNAWRYPDTAEEISEHVIIALALEEDGKSLASYSNWGGQHKQYALAAPVYPYGGTSSAAPVISAAAAMVIQRFPKLDRKGVVDLLLETADDLGDPGVDAKYGHGRLNLSRALSPNSRLR